MGIVVDDRTNEERSTHPYLVIGTDSFMSGWGHAEGGASYAVWACRGEDFEHVLRWVEGRGDMKRVRTADERHRRYRPSEHAAHTHIYVVGDNHVSLKGVR